MSCRWLHLEIRQVSVFTWGFCCIPPGGRVVIHGAGNEHVGLLQHCPHYRLNPVTVQPALLFSSCTIAPSAWNQQWNYNLCFVFAWSMDFDTVPFLEQISFAAFFWSSSDTWLRLCMRCCTVVLLTLLLSALYCAAACACRNSYCSPC